VCFDKELKGIAYRLLDTASRSGASVTPKQRPVMERALNLAIRLGLKTSALLDKVLDAKSGAAFYESFRRAVSNIGCVRLTPRWQNEVMQAFRGGPDVFLSHAACQLF
jgi:hypothetical protein